MTTAAKRSAANRQATPRRRSTDKPRSSAAEDRFVGSSEIDLRIAAVADETRTEVLEAVKDDLNELRANDKRQELALQELNGLKDDEGKIILPGKVDKLQTTVDNFIAESRAARASDLAAQKAREIAENERVVRMHSENMEGSDILAVRIGKLEKWQKRADARHRRVFRLIWKIAAKIWYWLSNAGKCWPQLVGIVIMFTGIAAGVEVIVYGIKDVIVRADAAIIQEFKRQPVQLKPVPRGK